jgi:hypothetical protein
MSQTYDIIVNYKRNIYYYLFEIYGFIFSNRAVNLLL